MEASLSRLQKQPGNGQEEAIGVLGKVLERGVGLAIAPGGESDQSHPTESLPTQTDKEHPHSTAMAAAKVMVTERAGGYCYSFSRNPGAYKL